MVVPFDSQQGIWPVKSHADFSLKMHQKRLVAMLRWDPLESLQCSPRSPSWIKRVGRTREGKRKRQEGRERDRGRNV